MTNSIAAYLKIIDTQRDTLDRLQGVFNQHCNEIKANTVLKLQKIAPDDKEKQAKTLNEQNQLLAEAFNALKIDVKKCQENSRKMLESLESEQDQVIVDDLIHQLI